MGFFLMGVLVRVGVLVGMGVLVRACWGVGGHGRTCTGVLVCV